MYKPDPGTFAEKGKDYEKIVTAFISLEALNNTDDFCLISNPRNCAPFDDVILCTKTKTENVIYLFQIKSKVNPTAIFDDEFTSNKHNSKFYIRTLFQRYPRCINEIKKIIPHCYVERCKFQIIVFTNRPMQENSGIFELITDKEIFNATHGKIYKFKNAFNLAEFDSKNHDFLESIKVYANQSGIDNSSINRIKQYLNSDDDIAKKIKLQYFMCIKNWCEIQTEREILTKDFIYRLFAYAIFVNFVVPIDFYNETDYRKYEEILSKKCLSLLWESIKNKNIRITWNHIQYILGMTFENLNINIENCDYYEQIIYDEFKTTKQQLKYNIGCLLGIFPFIVRDFNLIIPTEYFQYFKIIFIESHEGPASLIKIDESALHHLKSRTITTRSGQTYKIENLIEEIGENASISGLLNMLISCANNYNNEVGCFIRRKLNKVMLASNILFSKNSIKDERDIFIINVNGFSTEDFIVDFRLNKNQVLVVEFEREITEYLKLCEKSLKKDKHFRYILINNNRLDIKVQLPVSIHILQYFKYSPLQWIKSIGDTENIKKYRIDTACFDENNCKCCVYLENINTSLQNEFLVISGVPGLGKSTYLKQFTNFVSTNDFILFVTLMDFYDYFEKLESNWKSSSAEKHISYFCKDEDKVLKHIFETKLKTNKIIILFDGFDEITPRFTNIVTKIIKEIREANYKIILTTRSVLKHKVESVFGTFAMSLCPFSKQNQFTFMKRFLKKKSKISINASTFIKIITKCVDFEFLQVPLNILLISEILYTEVQNKDFNPTNFKLNLLQIYEQFINHKLNIFTEKITNKNINKLTINRYHHFFAVNKLFNKLDNFKIIKIPLIDALSNYTMELKSGGEKVGMLIDDNNEIFIHRTVAEYFAAKWLSNVYNPPSDYQYIKNEKQFALYIMKLIYSLKTNDDMDFAVIKSFVDSMINNGNELHQAAIKCNYEYLKNIFDCDRTAMKCLNILNRTLLHTIILQNDSLYCRDTMRININLVEILNLLIKRKDILTRKDFLHASVQDYVNRKKSDDFPLKIFVDKTTFNNQYSVYFSRNFELWEIFCEVNLYKCDIYEVLQALEKQNVVYTVVDAASNGNLTIIQQFYNSGIQNKINSKDLIHFAAENGHLNIVKFLNKRGIKRIIRSKFELKDNEKRTVLHYAVLSGNLDMVVYLMQNKVNLKSYECNGLTAFHYAVIHNQISIAEYFLTQDLNINFPCENGYVFLEYVTAFLNKKMFKFLLSKRADVDYRNKSRRSLIHLITYTYIYVNRNYNPEISEKYNKKCFNFITFLVETSLNINDKDFYGRSPLMIAVSENSSCVKILIENHADVTCVDNNGCTLLHMAAYNGNIITLELILQHIDINVNDNQKNSALLYAILNSDKIGCFKTVNFLIASGADPQCINNEGLTPLHYATYYGHIDVVKLLLAYTDINVQDSNGYTPLHYAIINEHADIVRSLINNNANINLSNNNNEFPSDFAKKHDIILKSMDITSMLSEMNAQSNGLIINFDEQYSGTSLNQHLKRIKQTVFNYNNFEYSNMFRKMDNFIDIIVHEENTGPMEIIA